MAVELATGYVTLLPSAKGFRAAIESEIGSDLDEAGGRAGDGAAKSFGGRFSTGIKNTAKVAAAGFATAFVGAIAIGKQSIDAASNLEEAQTKVNVVFGDGAGAVTDWASTASQGFGLSTRAALEAAGTYGNLFQAFGVGQQPATEMSQTLVQLATDLASFNNTSTDEALAALQSGLSGETEPLKRYGVALSDVRLKQKALELGLISSTTEALTPAAKAQASYALIMQDTTLAQGDFARTSDGLANQQRILGARFEDAKAAIGTALLPAITSVVNVIADRVIPKVQELAQQWMPKLRQGFEFVAQFVRDNWPQIQATVQAVLDGVRSAITDVVDIVTTIWNNFGEQILSVVQTKFESMMQAVQGGLDIIRGFFQTISALIHGDWSGVWDGLKQIVDGAWQVIRAFVEDGLNTIRQILSAAWEVIVAAVSATWEGIKSLISDAISAVVTFISELPGRAAGALASLASVIGAKFVETATTAKEKITGLITNAVELLLGLPAKAAGALGELGAALGGAIVNAGYEVARKVSDVISNAVELMKGLPGKMVSAIGDLAGSVSSAVFGAFKSGVNAAIQQVNNLIPNSIGLLGFSLDLPDNPIPTLHSGGIVPGTPGTDVPTILQAGELVVSRAQLANGMFGGGGPTINVAGSILGEDDFRRFIRHEVELIDWQRRTTPMAGAVA